MKLLCKLGFHNWTGKGSVDVVLMRIFTGDDEGCIRCGITR